MPLAAHPQSSSSLVAEDRPDRLTAAPLNTILSAFEALQLGLVILDNREARIVYANALGSEVIQVLGGALDGPQTLNHSVREIQLSDGRSYSVREQDVPSIPGTRVLLLLPTRMRESDLAAILKRRFGLTPRQCDLVGLLRRGHSNQEIADLLHLQSGSVRTYFTQIFGRLGVRSRTELVALLADLPREEMVPGV